MTGSLPTTTTSDGLPNRSAGAPHMRTRMCPHCWRQTTMLPGAVTLGDAH